MNGRSVLIIMLMMISLLPLSCLNDKLDDSCEATYYSITIKPFLISNCANSIDCHVTNGNAAADFTRYNEVFKYKDEIIRRLTIDPNESDFMPKGGQAISKVNLQMLKDWVTLGAKGCDK